METVWQNRRSQSGHCDGCPGCDAPYPLTGVGNRYATVMLVGQEPAYNVDDDRIDMDMSWYDAADQVIKDRKESMNPLWKHMMNVAVAADCAPEDLYFTNLAKCDDGDSDWHERFDHCHTYFAREIALVDPSVLLLYGTKVSQAVFEMFGLDLPDALGDAQGNVYETSSLNLVPLYHWGYAYRRGNVDEYNDTVREIVQEVLR